MQFAWGGCLPLASANLRECQIAKLKASLWPAEKHGNHLADPGSRLVQCDWDDYVPRAQTNRQESQIAELKASRCPAESTGEALEPTRAHRIVCAGQHVSLERSGRQIQDGLAASRCVSNGGMTVRQHECHVIECVE